MRAKAILETYYDELDTASEDGNAELNTVNYSRMFVAHGHDGELKHVVARLIERQGIEAVILSEQSNQGQTIIEKLEREGDAAAAVCLFTADDIDCKRDSDEQQSRARQNVVFEAGFFIGRNGRSNIVSLVDPGVEILSDLHGVVYTSTTNWQFSLLNELRTIGYSVDMNKVIL
jgi:predicted nucleotide-binding protein